MKQPSLPFSTLSRGGVGLNGEGGGLVDQPPKGARGLLERELTVIRFL